MFASRTCRTEKAIKSLEDGLANRIAEQLVKMMKENYIALMPKPGSCRYTGIRMVETCLLTILQPALRRHDFCSGSDTERVKKPRPVVSSGAFLQSDNTRR